MNRNKIIVGIVAFSVLLAGSSAAFAGNASDAAPGKVAVMVAFSDGTVFCVNGLNPPTKDIPTNEPHFGSAPYTGTDSWVVATAETPDHAGYWTVTGNGKVRPYGSARHFGDTSGAKHTSVVVGMAATSTGEGYWILTADGNVLHFGDATPVDSPASGDDGLAVGIFTLTAA